MKKLFIIPLLCASLFFGSTSAFAAEPIEVEGPVRLTVAAAGDGRTRASWGQGKLTHANPLGRKPWAYATSSTYSGTCFKIKARTKVISDGQTDYTSWAVKENASSVTSATMIARTEENVTFNGLHEFKDTSSSGWQYATTSASY